MISSKKLIKRCGLRFGISPRATTVSTMSNFRRSTPFFSFHHTAILVATMGSSVRWIFSEKNGHVGDGSPSPSLLPYSLFFLFLLCVYRGAMAVGLSKGRVRQKKKYREKENHAMAWTPTRVLYLAYGHCSSRGTVAFFFPFYTLLRT